MAIRRRHNGGIRDEFLDAIITHGGNAIVREGWRQAGNAVGEHLGSTAGNFVRANGERAVNYIGGLHRGSSEHATNEVATARLNPRPRDDTARRGDFINQLTKTLIANVAKPSKRRNPALPAPVEPVPEPTPTAQSNSPATTQMGNDGNEVPVVPPPRKISKITPDYFTNICPYYVMFAFHGASGNIRKINDDPILIRCNSVWDPIVGTTADTQPQGRDQWASLFKYYRVLKSEIKVKWYNMNPPASESQLTTSTAGFTFGSPFQGAFLCGYEVVEDDAPAGIANDIFSFMCGKHAKRASLPPAKVRPSITYVAPDYIRHMTVVAPGMAETNYTYVPEQYDHHIMQNTTADRWTLVSASPNVDHYIALRCFHKGDNSVWNNKDTSIFCEVYIEYTVQWREAADSLTHLTDSTGASGNDTAPNT